MKTKPMLSLEDAKRVAAAAEAEALRNKRNVVIAICDDGGHLLLLHGSTRPRQSLRRSRLQRRAQQRWASAKRKPMKI
jgi:Haem-degrading